MKICNKCKENKQESDFTFKNKSKGYLQPNCKSCDHEFHRIYYIANKNQTLIRNKRNQAKYISSNRSKLIDFLSKNSCVDCGESNLLVLQFDHLDRSQKEYEVSRLVNCGWPWTTVEREIAKCAVRCANCHLKRTNVQLGWYKSKL